MARKAQSKSEKSVGKASPEQLTDDAIQETSQVAVELNPTPLSACGGALKLAREKQKLSLQEVASQLRLGIKQVEALETDRFDKLPEPSIVKGFIRNYAKLLKIDPIPITDAYSVMVPNVTPKSFAVKSNVNASVIGESRPNFSFTSFIGLFLFFALVVWSFYYYTQVIKPNVATDSSNINAPINEADMPANHAEFALPAAERQAEAVTPIALPQTESTPIAMPPASIDGVLPNTTDASQLTAQSQAVPSADSTQAGMAPITTEAVKPSTAPLPDKLPQTLEQNTSIPSTTESIRAKLIIDASDETWVNVIDSNGKQVYSKVLSAGASETVLTTSPLSITVGNAQATSISVNGKPLDLLAHTRDRVARIKVN